MHLTILGGGPAGLGLAHYAHRAGMPFDLYEQSEVLGGLCHTFHAGRHAYDAGAHRFHDRDPAITADVRALLGDELQRVTTRSKIFDRGRFVDFPPTPLNLLRSHDPGGLLRSAVDLLRARLNPSDERSFEDHAVRRFGRALAERYLLGYSEKVWGLPAAELSPDVATRRLSGMSLTTLVHELLGPGRAATHIDGAFYYPRRGYGAIALALAASVPEERLHRGKRVTGLRIEGNGVTRVRFDDGTRAAVPAGGRVVSTLPITALAGLCGDAFGADALAAAERLRFRTIRLFFLRLLRPRVTDNATLYLPDRALCLTRVHEPKNRSAAMGPPEETALVCEVPCFPGDALATPPPEVLVERVIAELTEIGLIARGEVAEWNHHLLPAAYPVYAIGYEADLTRALRGVHACDNLDVVGRSARFSYSHLHDQLRWARDHVFALDAPDR